MSKRNHLVMRMIDRTMGTDHRDRVFDASTARMGPDMTVEMNRAGAWAGSVFGVWSYPVNTAQIEALNSARFVSPHQVFVVTDLGWLAEVHISECDDVRVLSPGDD